MPKGLSKYPGHLLALLLSLLLWGTWNPVASQTNKGHRVTSSSITVNSASHWQNWQLPDHAVDLSPDGSVQPHFFRDRYNILDDLETFTRPLDGFIRKTGETAILNVDSTETRDVYGNIIVDRRDNVLYSYFLRPGISRVGSNPEQAANILDGDPNTYWEPDPNAPLEDWWIEVDIGRVVPVDSLILHFVDAETGDPFRQFRVLVAGQQRTIKEDEDKLDFISAAGTDGPNADQRLFGFGFVQNRASDDWTGRMIETIRIVVSDTKAGQARKISEEEWLALPAADRGDIVYFIQDLQGFEEPVSEASYNSVTPERQGRKDYYIRERPRLADVEVWGSGDNISLGMVAGGGSLFLTGGTFAPGPGFDGDFTTNFLHLVFSPTIDRGVLTVDMGGTFWLDSMRISTSRPRPFIDGYIVRGSDGSLDANGRLKWRRISSRARENNSVDRYENLLDQYDEAPKLRFLEMSIVSVDPRRRGGYNTGPNIAEYQIFSQAYPAEVVLTSDLIELSTARNFGAINWEAFTPPGTNLEIRTRTGDLLGKVVSFYDNSGSEITFEAWDNLVSRFRGPADTTFVPASGWSPWSRAYKQPGDLITSPGLRKFMQLQVKMTTSDRNTAASISSIDIELLDPVAQRLVGEVWPAEVPIPGLVDTFDVFIQPDFIELPADSRSIGFDEILLSMPASQQLQLIDLSLGHDPATSQSAQVFRPLGTGLDLADADGNQTPLLQDRSDSIWVRLPNTINILPQSQRLFNRITLEGDQVPVTQDGQPLTGAGYGVLEEEEQGDIRFFRRTASGQTQVQQLAYDSLPAEEKGPIGYYRILLGDGAQFPFDANGDSLNQASYNQLPSSQRGMVTGAGGMVKMRFKAPIFLNGTTLRTAVRNTVGGTELAAPWQSVEAGDANDAVGANTLSIAVPVTGAAIEDFAIAPNPFTPNGDAINDATQIHFSIFKLTAARDIEVRIASLDGRTLWTATQSVRSGQTAIAWNGTDAHGALVPPGLYLCQIKLDADAGNSNTRSRLISVAY
ncbi:MAG: hypothetical protein GKR89_21925 [Candidatus Latescibacteria bacterium]|nr:hypothetical protein [Candidatus Latescibacterota bacterium]